MSVAHFKPTPFRPHDYVYDPLFTVSGPKDHCKAALVARLQTAKFQVCPIFPNMFSDLPNHPRKHLVRRKSAPARSRKVIYSKTDDKKVDFAQSRPVDVVGVDRAKFFLHMPRTNVGADFIPPLPIFIELDPETKKEGKTKLNYNKKVQTKFRESEAQTSPWEPSFVVTSDTDPELLKLDFLKWGSGLPAGMHEVELIERARMKRAWEAKCEVKNAADLENRRNIITAMERDEWAFREQEIQDIQDLRLKLLENMLSEMHEKSKNRSEAKLMQFAELKNAEKEEKLRKLRHKTRREIRKIDMKALGINPKYHPVNVIDEHVNYSSEIYGPMMRHGSHPKRWHQVVDDTLQRFRAQFRGVEEFNTLPTWIDKATKIKDCCCLKLPGTRLCMRETKWTAPVLRALHEELIALRRPVKKQCTLLRRIDTPSSVCSTPEVEGISDQDENYYQSIVFLQGVIKGRAAQMHIYEGRERCRELIQELKYSSGLLDEEQAMLHDYMLKIKLRQRDEQIATEKISRLQESLDKLQGTLIGSLLDFLNKELRRLMEERRAHAICILLERERYDREASEAGRRQVELRRRREHDEMFKQICKIQQETVDLYLEDIVREGTEFASTEEARDYVKALAKTIDEEAYKAQRYMSQTTFNEEEEAISNMIHHFVLPEVQKQLIRQQMQRKQKEKLRTVRDTIFAKIEEVPYSAESKTE